MLKLKMTTRPLTQIRSMILEPMVRLLLMGQNAWGLFTLNAFLILLLSCGLSFEITIIIRTLFFILIYKILIIILRLLLGNRLTTIQLVACQSDSYVSWVFSGFYLFIDFIFLISLIFWDSHLLAVFIKYYYMYMHSYFIYM